MKTIAADPAFIGIGFAKAAKLAKAFGHSLADRLAAGDPRPFAAVVGEREAKNLVVAWKDGLARRELASWLALHGIDQRIAARAMQVWGANSQAALERHPYAMMAFAEWREVDAFARNLGVEEFHPERLIAAVEAILYRRLARQHTWTSDGATTTAVARLLDTTPARAKKAVELAEAAEASVPIGGGWQPAGAAMMEAHVADRIHAMVAMPGRDTDVDPSPTATKFSAALDKEQRRAIATATRSHVSLILGGAGVGKTTTLRALCATCEGIGLDIHLMAVAGRAAARMREATDRPASTLAAFLQGCERKKIVLGPDSLVVVDEASMVDLAFLYRLLRKMPDGAALVLVGDEAQLGPIGFGLTLHVLAEKASIPTTRLVRIHRQAEGSSIPIVAAEVRKGSLPPLTGDIDSGCGVMISSTERPPTTEDVVDLVDRLGGFSDKMRIISPVKAGEAGVLALNARFHERCATGRSEPGLIVGEPVMFGRNDYRRDLRNGSLGTVVDTSRNVLSVDFEGTVHEFFGAAVADVSLAYAITVHKAQGSEFETVVMPIVPTMFVDRSLVYTALTRAAKRIVLVGRHEDLAEAVARSPEASRRETGLRWRLL